MWLQAVIAKATYALTSAGQAQGIEIAHEELLDLNLPESVVDEQLRQMGVDPVELEARGTEYVAKLLERTRYRRST
jgi:hypothetical protein